jgi:putative FmdB family regulatory protein
MPLYAFECAACGPFETFRGVAESAAPMSCPHCHGDARRVFTPPRLRLLAPPLRRARDREEKSAHEPDVVSHKTGRPMPHRHSHVAPMPWIMSH